MMRFASFLVCLCLVWPAHAGFSIVGTRVIYHDAEGEAAVHLQRVTGETPVLLQSWMDDGSPDAKPGEQDLPFLVTPSVVRVGAGGAQVIRIVRIRNDIPDDRETLLYFNVLEVPPVVDDGALGDKNYLQFAMQARMKFFYRPKGLPLAPEEAFDLLRFSLHTAVGQVRLRVHNPTPYHITMPNLGVYAANAGENASPLVKFQETGIAPMVSPFGELDVALGERTGNVHGHAAAEMRVRYTVINDQGGIVPKSVALGQTP